MSAELDLEFRSAVFAHIQGLRDAMGGVVTRSMLDEGIQFHAQRQPIWNRYTGIFRPAILRDPGAALTIQTAVDGPYDDRWNPDDDRFTYKYRGKDPNHNDNRAVRRAMELGLPLLYLVGVKQGVFEPVMPCYVVGDDPASLTFYLVADAERLVAVPSPNTPEEWPRKAYITREVKKRLHQDRFRFLVLDAYREQCTMCRLKHVALLEAAHIIPDHDVRGMPEVPNGLALCRIHHGAFDVGIVGVSPDYQVHVRRDVLEEHDGPMLRHGLQEMDGIRIHLPNRPADRPNPDYLAERFKKFQAA